MQHYLTRRLPPDTHMTAVTLLRTSSAMVRYGLPGGISKMAPNSPAGSIIAAKRK